MMPPVKTPMANTTLRGSPSAHLLTARIGRGAILAGGLHHGIIEVAGDKKLVTASGARPAYGISDLFTALCTY
jgi:hypothetical protein